MKQHGAIMSTRRSRRALLGAGAFLPVIFMLPGCEGIGSGFSLTEALKRLLSLSTQKAFAQLMAPNGFYDSQVARITLPDQLGGSTGGSMLSRVLISTVLKDRLTRTVNRAAEKGAERAAPIVANAITTLPVSDALAILRGGGSGATDLLRGALGDQLLSAMLPDVGNALQLIDNDAVSQALKLATGLDFSGLSADVTRKASDAIYAAIAQEEIMIRANPQATGDPLLIAALSAMR